jgi:hypothetical protein
MKVDSISRIRENTGYTVNEPVRAGGEEFLSFHVIKIVRGDTSCGLKVKTPSGSVALLSWNLIKDREFKIMNSPIIPQKRRVGAR